MSNISKIKLADGNIYNLKDSSIPEWARGNGQIPSGSLPSYVDDVIEGYYIDGFFYENSDGTNIIAGERGKIYVDISANGSVYRYSGSSYIEVAKGTSYELASQTQAGLMSSEDKTKLDKITMSLYLENGKLYAESL